MFYRVIFKDFKILEFKDSINREKDIDFDNYNKAKQVLIKYLEDYIEDCKDRLDEIINDEDYCFLEE